MASSSSSSPEPVAPIPPEYVGFWKRLIAFAIDVLILVVVLGPILLLIYGKRYFALERLLTGQTAGVWDWLLQLLVVIAGLLFWRFRGATPGKMVVAAKIVDGKTGGPPSTGKLVVRMLAYLVSFPITLGLGFLWIAFDRRKQGFHDKIAGTVVINRED